MIQTQNFREILQRLSYMHSFDALQDAQSGALFTLSELDTFIIQFNTKARQTEKWFYMTDDGIVIAIHEKLPPELLFIPVFRNSELNPIDT